ncbi:MULTISPECIES: DNA methyltransferase [Bacillus subtilis group]|uniref:DNA methyltransferase n=1 Tax=Bacillus subtilis group TaxID=653685 RepID=UPI00034CDE59|nr:MULTISPECIES: DNA methyltransferase [Bacillus subtilis group]AKD37304.1 Modification methylase [Bacillus subtilis HJ5]ASK26166.1 Modification methylase [Bacillus subtilis]MCL9627695.1 DNA methyltransferase [Bacillus subtilis]MDE1384364.1 DNA methyltransferase [Bacillus paralicheniformis]MED2946244.1 DNA methyltransferase [Bacillus subtilis]
MKYTPQKIFKTIDDFPYDRTSVSQSELDLDIKERKSLFPWRGQFSPCLIELFLDRYSKPDDVIFDPFAGSGTTLFESARKNLKCYGAEINPSAITMSKTVEFINMSTEDREKLCNAALLLLKKYIRESNYDLFNMDLYEEKSAPFEIAFKKMLNESPNSQVINILTNALIRFKSYRGKKALEDYYKALHEHIKIIKNLPYSENICEVFHTDARSIPLANDSVDLIITSPPYINVFNYHQNNREAMEFVGWNVLEVAKSEMGSNRKHRQNRFLTVIQYSMDILEALIEMRRLLTPSGRVIIVVGRESKIRGVPLKNGRLVAALAYGGAGFKIENMQERKFTNKFGELIYEDIIHLTPSNTSVLDESYAKNMANELLKEALIMEKDENIRIEILNAINKSDSVKKSPIFEMDF